MQFVNLEGNNSQSCNKLTENISSMIIGYLNHFKVKIFWEDSEYYLQDCFDPYCLLPLFIFEQEQYIAQYLIKLNESQLIKRHVNIVAYKDEDKSLLNYFINLEHNLTEKESY